MERKPFVISEPPKLFLGRKWNNGRLVEYPVSYTYNGGIVVDGEWYSGFEVPGPVIPEGYELISIGIGLNLNARPPFATSLLRPAELRDQRE